MIIEPRMRDLFVWHHTDGCAQNVKKSNWIRKIKGTIAGGKKVLLVIGASTGLG
jgi:enoyl-[acyl-carrier protein] reductase/trans-2-enoyl-CoA reductase (NAD+)